MYIMLVAKVTLLLRSDFNKYFIITSYTNVKNIIILIDYHILFFKLIKLYKTNKLYTYTFYISVASYSMINHFKLQSSS